MYSAIGQVHKPATLVYLPLIT
jgi:hypothetical protein